MPTRAQIVEEARTWIDPVTPWIHQGRAKGIGVDCLGLIGMVALACGIPGAREWRDAPEFHSYGRIARPALLAAGCDRFLDQIPIQTIDVADILVMSFRKYPQHFALVSRPFATHVIHAYESIGRVVENGAAVANARVYAAYRFRGLV